MKLYLSILSIITICFLGASIYYVTPVINTGTSVIYEKPANNVKGGSKVLIKTESLSQTQLENLQYAREIAIKDGHKSPEILQGLIMQESAAGTVKNFRVSGLQNSPSDRYFGVAQIKLAAAKDVMATYPELWKGFSSKTAEELQAKLILDDKFNISVASKYLLLMNVNKNLSAGITSYNRGPAGSLGVDHSTFDYTLKVKKYAEKFKYSEQKFKMNK
jgi:hypothetical protein